MANHPLSTEEKERILSLKGKATLSEIAKVTKRNRATVWALFTPKTKERDPNLFSWQDYQKGII